MPTTYWSPNQTAVSQVETYTYIVPNGVGNTYTATINGKTVTYTSVSGDTALTVAAAHYALLSNTAQAPPELNEITFSLDSTLPVITATATTPGTPFANQTINGVSGVGLVMSTGNGLANGITTAHTTANKSPSDVNDPLNWLRFTPPAPGVRSIPISGDDVVVNNTSTPMLWNLDRLNAVSFNTYTRWQSMSGDIGLPEKNPNGYDEWRATYFKFTGPSGSVPAGGLQMVLGYSSGSGNGPSRERYNVGSTPTTLTVLATGQASDEYGVRFLGDHTANTFTLIGSVSLGVGMLAGETSKLSSCTADSGALVGIGAGVTWTAGSTLTLNGGSAILNSAPATLALSNGATATIATDLLTWATITAQGGSTLTMLAGGTITTLTLATSSQLDKSQDARTLTITNSTMDGDTCLINDPLNCIVFTNATSVREQVASGPIRFTGTRTVKVT